jgi:hypothetical protein
VRDDKTLRAIVNIRPNSRTIAGIKTHRRGIDPAAPATKTHEHARMVLATDAAR